MFTTPVGGTPAAGGVRGRETDPGAVGRRGVSPRRRLELGGVSPPAPKRPAAYVQPGNPSGPEMNTQMLSNEMYRQRDAIAAIHEWVASIYDSSIDHAGQLESAARQFQAMKEKHEEYTGTVATGLQEAETKLVDKFNIAEAAINELRGNMTNTQKT